MQAIRILSPAQPSTNKELHLIIIDGLEIAAEITIGTRMGTL